MTVLMKLEPLVLATGLLTMARSATADPVADTGVGISVGGGIAGFTDRAMRETVTADVAPLWDVRALVGTHSPIGVEASYIGSAGTVRTLTGSEDGTLVGTTFEATARWNILPHMTWNPFVFAGVGWQHYGVQNMSLATSDTGLDQSDNLLEIPMGAGVSFRDPNSGFTFEVRSTFRAAVANATLVAEPNGGYAGMHTWEASAAFGWDL